MLANPVWENYVSATCVRRLKVLVLLAAGQSFKVRRRWRMGGGKYEKQHVWE